MYDTDFVGITECSREGYIGPPVTVTRITSHQIYSTVYC